MQPSLETGHPQSFPVKCGSPGSLGVPEYRESRYYLTVRILHSIYIFNSLKRQIKKYTLTKTVLMNNSLQIVLH